MPSNVSDQTLTGGTSDSGSSFAPFVAPQDLSAAALSGGSKNAALYMADPIGGSNNNVAPFMAPRQDLGVAPNGEGSNATPFMAPHQYLILASNGDQLVMENAIMGPQGHGPVATMQGDDPGITASMLPSDQYEDNTSFPLEALLGDLHGPIFEFDDVDLDALVSGSTSGTSADAADGVGGMDDSAISSLDGLEIPEGLFAEYGNNICG
ncbi:unnamed protein product [Urochloa humidicola]